jgi:hypothetical protein
LPGTKRRGARSTRAATGAIIPASCLDRARKNGPAVRAAKSGSGDTRSTARAGGSPQPRDAAPRIANRSSWVANDTRARISDDTRSWVANDTCAGIPDHSRSWVADDTRAWIANGSTRDTLIAWIADNTSTGITDDTCAWIADGTRTRIAGDTAARIPWRPRKLRFRLGESAQ